MMLCFSFSKPQIASRSMLKATGKHWFVAISSLVSSTIGILISVILMQFTSLGVVGAAIGWSVKNFALDGVLFPLVISQDLGIGKLNYFKKVYVTPLTNALIIILMAEILTRLITSESIWSFGIQVLLFGIVAGLTMYFSLEKNHRPNLSFLSR